LVSTRKESLAVPGHEKSPGIDIGQNIAVIVLMVARLPTMDLLRIVNQLLSEEVILRRNHAKVFTPLSNQNLIFLTENILEPCFL
jgi:hypothetical protein